MSDTMNTDEVPEVTNARPSRWSRVRWIALAAVVAVLLVAGTAVGTAAIVDDSDGDAESDEHVSLVEDEHISLVEEDVIARTEAERLAVAAAGGGTVTEVQLDEENGALVYEVEIQDAADPAVDHDVVLDARTGRILERET